MENVIRNIVTGQTDGVNTGFELARSFADERQKKTGNKCVVRRVLDNVDTYNGRDREWFSFDVVEILEVVQ